MERGGRGRRQWQEPGPVRADWRFHLWRRLVIIGKRSACSSMPSAKGRRRGENGSMRYERALPHHRATACFWHEGLASAADEPRPRHNTHLGTPTTHSQPVSEASDRTKGNSQMLPVTTLKHPPLLTHLSHTISPTHTTSPHKTLCLVGLQSFFQMFRHWKYKNDSIMAQ